MTTQRRTPDHGNITSVLLACKTSLALNLMILMVVTRSSLATISYTPRFPIPTGNRPLLGTVSNSQTDQTKE